MKSMKRTLLLLWLLGCGWAVLTADDATPGGKSMTLDVDTAVALALTNNISLKETEITLNDASRNVRASWNNFLPSIDLAASLAASGEVLASPEASATADHWRLEVSLGATFSLNAGVVPALEQTKLAYEAAHIGYTTARNGLARNVRKLFFKILALKEDARIKKENMDLAGKRYQKARANFDNGLAPELDVFTARVNWEGRKPAYTQAVLDYRTALLDLKEMIGLEGATNIEPVGSLQTDFLTLDRDKIVARWLDSIPDLRLKRNELRRMETAKDAAVCGNLTPTLTLYGSWGTTVADPWNGASWDAGAFGVSLTFPLDGFIPDSQKSVAVQKADDAVARARLELQRLRTSSMNTVDVLFMRLEAYREKIELSALNSELAEKTFVLTEETYKSGTSELLAVANAQQELLSARQDYLVAGYNYLSTLIELEAFFDRTLEELTEE
ncbi:MAG: TolC family protein [Spirochaetales bacterium]|nr:TolC family protein [Spirochaetales bacterium]